MSDFQISQSLGRQSIPGRRIVLTTFGSFGDLHPYIAIALELRARGHEPILATLDMYREKVESLGLPFRSVRWVTVDAPNAEVMKQAMDLKHGSEFIVRNLLLPSLENAYADMLAAAEGAELFISHPMTFATRLVAETKSLPWVSSQLAPLGFFSAYDPPVLAQAPITSMLRFVGPFFFRQVLKVMKLSIYSWTEPYRRLRSELKLSPTANPFFGGMDSPYLNLALFSKFLGPAQPDWPTGTITTGFPFFDHDGDAELEPELNRFLDAGPPPIVFTLGTAAVMDAGSFYEVSAAAAQRLGQRAVLLVGRDLDNRPKRLSKDIITCDYAPFSKIFPRAAVIVHQGGVGTTGQAMASGRPMLVMPYSHDQPDNAARLRRLGIARVISRAKYTEERATNELGILLSDPKYAANAAQVGRRVQQEHGVQTACDAVENLLKTVPAPRH